jgi:uncharacterized protein HemY
MRLTQGEDTFEVKVVRTTIQVQPGKVDAAVARMEAAEAQNARMRETIGDLECKIGSLEYPACTNA